jgi:hypothetical protein
MTAAFADTFYFLALLDSREEQHAQAADVRLQTAAARRFPALAAAVVKLLHGKGANVARLPGRRLRAPANRVSSPDRSRRRRAKPRFELPDQV